MVSTRRNKQSNKRLLSQLVDFDQDVIIGNVASDERETFLVNEGGNDRVFTIGTSSDNLAFNESSVNVKTLERCFIETFDRELCNIVDTVEDRLQIAILAAIDSIVAP